MAGGEAGDDLALAVHEEFGEVPLDVAAELGVGLLAGQEGVERRLGGREAVRVSRPARRPVVRERCMSFSFSSRG